MFFDEINTVKYRGFEVGCDRDDNILFRVNVNNVAAVADG